MYGEFTLNKKGTAVMKACASASGGVIFIPDSVSKKKCKASNDNPEGVDIAEDA